MENDDVWGSLSIEDMDKIIEVIARSEEQAVDCNDGGGACSSEEDAEEVNAQTSDDDWQDAQKKRARNWQENSSSFREEGRKLERRNDQSSREYGEIHTSRAS